MNTSKQNNKETTKSMKRKVAGKKHHEPKLSQSMVVSRPPDVYNKDIVPPSSSRKTPLPTWSRMTSCTLVEEWDHRETFYSSSYPLRLNNKRIMVQLSEISTISMEKVDTSVKKVYGSLAMTLSDQPRPKEKKVTLDKVEIIMGPPESTRDWPIHYHPKTLTLTVYLPPKNIIQQFQRDVEDHFAAKYSEMQKNTDQSFLEELYDFQTHNRVYGECLGKLKSIWDDHLKKLEKLEPLLQPPTITTKRTEVRSKSLISDQKISDLEALIKGVNSSLKKEKKRISAFRDSSSTKGLRELIFQIPKSSSKIGADFHSLIADTLTTGLGSSFVHILEEQKRTWGDQCIAYKTFNPPLLSSEARLSSELKEKLHTILKEGCSNDSVSERKARDDAYRSNMKRHRKKIEALRTLFDQQSLDHRYLIHRPGACDVKVTVSMPVVVKNNDVFYIDGDSQFELFIPHSVVLEVISINTGAQRLENATSKVMFSSTLSKGHFKELMSIKWTMKSLISTML